MCGIVGVINANTRTVPALSSFIKDAVYAGAVRGLDSIGIGTINAAGDRNIYKDTLAPSSFMATKRGMNLASSADANYVTLVHHRAATIGGVTPDAAQPFGWNTNKHKHQTLTCHNGTLTNHNKVEQGVDFVSDSDWLAYKIASNVDAETGVADIDAVVSAVKGSYSIVTVVNGVLYMANNGQRPMHWAFSEDESYVLFASEPGMLYWLADRNGIKIKDNVITSVASGVLHKFEFGVTKNKVIHSTSELTKPEVVVPPAPMTSLVPFNYAARTSSLTELDAIYAKVIAGGYAEGAPKAKTDPSIRASLLPPGASKARLQAGALVGTTVQFLVNGFDDNLKVATGVAWLEDEHTSETFTNDELSVLAGGSVMIPGGMFSASTVSDSRVYQGRVTSVSVISEFIDGKKTEVPYMMLAKSSVKLVVGTVPETIN